MSLFRHEAIDAQRKRLFGEVTLHQPVTLPLFTAILALCTAGLILFACLGAFATKETVGGAIVPKAGLANIVASRAGVVESLFTNVGSEVAAGSPLISISSDMAVTRGELGELQLGQARQRMAELELQLAAQAAQASAERERLKQGILANRREIERLRNSLGYQLQQLDLSEKQLARIDPLVQQGYMSQLERDRRAAALLSQKQSIEDVNRTIESREAAIADIEVQIAQLGARAEGERSQLRSAQSLLAQSLDEIDAQGRAIIKAPVSGRVVALQVHQGTSVASGMLIATVSPKGSPLQAEIMIPTRAAGFVSEGQPVRLMVDAFPYQKFGYISGTIREIQRVPQPLSGDQMQSTRTETSAYKALVDLPKPYVLAYGETRMLETGMSVTADIVTGRKTLLQAAMEPLKAMSRVK